MLTYLLNNSTYDGKLIGTVYDFEDKKLCIADIQRGEDGEGHIVFNDRDINVDEFDSAYRHIDDSDMFRCFIGSVSLLRRDLDTVLDMFEGWNVAYNQKEFNRSIKQTYFVNSSCLEYGDAMEQFYYLNINKLKVFRQWEIRERVRLN